jgi:hypothetical protein
LKLVDVIRRHVLLTVVLVLAAATLVFIVVTVALYAVGEEVPGDRGDVFP